MNTRLTVASLGRWLRQPAGRPLEGTRGATRSGGAEGQALVEFALCLPVLIIALVGMVEAGLLLRSQMTVQAAVNEGVRVASSRGNADPSIAYGVYKGNDVNDRVGLDGDLVLVQNVNTALQSERQNVTLLMTYRADATEGITATAATGIDPVTGNKMATQVGTNGIGGAYGVFYRPDLSIYPFQEIFDFELRPVDASKPTGAQEKWFLPKVMDQARCTTFYSDSDQANPGAKGYKTAAGNTPSPGAFCGDASSVSVSAAITRSVPLGVTNGSANNIQQIQGKLRYPTGSSTCSVANIGSTSTAIYYTDALQCFRYNIAPWYPSLRRAQDIGLNPSNNRDTDTYQNNQGEAARYFAQTGEPNRSADYIGVQIVYEHKAVLSFVPASGTFSVRSQKIMEPVGGSWTPPVLNAP